MFRGRRCGTLGFASGWCGPSTSQCGRLALSSADRVVLRHVVIGIVEFFEPLREFEIILEPTLYKSLDGNYFVDTLLHTET